MKRALRCGNFCHSSAMQHQRKYLWMLWGITFLCLSLAARADDRCAICGKPIYGTIHVVTDKVTGQKEEICADCIKLPTCYICGMPVKDGLQLPDGRWLCARDAKTVVLKKDDILQISGQVKDDLDRLFARFTTFPENVDVIVIDRIDVNSMFDTEGNAFESPDLLGCIRPETEGGQKRYKMSVLTGMPQAQVKETCAHEYSHAWVGENVSKERHARLARDAEEGFCEMVGYLLMDSQNEELEKKRVLQNHYTRGQVELFIEAEQRFGLDEVLDWMKYGVAPKLEAGHVDEIRDVQMPSASSTAGGSAVFPAANQALTKPAPAPTTIKLEGISWGNRPTAIINGHTFEANDLDRVRLGNTNVTIRCLEIRQRSVCIQFPASGKEQELLLPSN